MDGNLMELNRLLSYLQNLLLEKQLVLSPTIIGKLREINDKVSDFILACFYEKLDLDTDYSYIDFVKDDGMVSFLKNRWDNDNLPSENFSSNRREKMKIGRLIIALASKKGVSFTNKEVEDFVNKYKSTQIDLTKKIKLVKGEEIIKWYNENSYDESGGSKTSLYNSCMRFDTCKNYFDVYTKNDNVVLCILLNDENKLQARAIVWLNNTKVNGNDDSYMDRIYSINDGVEQAMKDYAKSKEWWYKPSQGNDETSISNGTYIKENPVIETYLPLTYDWEEGFKPFMDSLRYLKEKIIGNEIVYYLTNISGDDDDYIQTWNTTNGRKNINSLYKNPIKLFRILKNKLNVNISDIKVDDDIFKVGNDEYQYFNILHDYDKLFNKYFKNMNNEQIRVLMTYMGIDEKDYNKYVNLEKLKNSFEGEISELLENKLIKTSYECLNLELLEDLIKGIDDEILKNITKKLVTKNYNLFKKHINNTVNKLDRGIINDRINYYIAEYGFPAPLKTIIGKEYNIDLNDNFIIKPHGYKSIKVYNDEYEFLNNLWIPEDCIDITIPKTEFGNKSKKSIDFLCEYLFKPENENFLKKVVKEVIFHLFIGKLNHTKPLKINDRIVCTDRDTNSKQRLLEVGTIVIIESEMGIMYDRKIGYNSLENRCEYGYGIWVKKNDVSKVDSNVVSEFEELIYNFEDKYLYKNILGFYINNLPIERIKQLINISDNKMNSFIDVKKLYDDLLLDGGLKDVLDFIFISDDTKYILTPEKNGAFIKLN